MCKCIGGIAHEAVSSLATHKTSKSFGDLFEEKKTQLNPLQVGLAASVMPKTPPMPAAKYSDFGFGIDLHKALLPIISLFPISQYQYSLRHYRGSLCKHHHLLARSTCTTPSVHQ